MAPSSVAFESTSGEESGRPLSTTQRQRKRKLSRFLGEEIALAEALESELNNDLACQLYNVHSYKRLARSNASAEASIDSRERKNEWLPGHRWTAWPMTVKNVPLENERWMPLSAACYREVRDALSSRTKIKPSQELEDALLAHIVCLCRDKYRASESMTFDLEPARSVSTTRAGIPRSDDQALGGEPSMNSTERALVDSPELLDSDFASRNPPHSADASMSSNEDKTRPLLKPTARALLGNFDELLNAMHISCQIHKTRVTLPKKKQGQEIQLLTVQSQASKSYSLKTPETPKPTVSIPRDWSVVLGCALMSGWSMDVVELARKRCSYLFGEDVDLTTISSTQNLVRSKGTEESIERANGSQEDFTSVMYRPEAVDPDLVHEWISTMR